MVFMVLMVGAGVMTADPTAGSRGTVGFACKGVTTNPELNRMMCQFSPEKIWNMKLGEIIPGLDAKLSQVTGAE